MRLLRIGRNDTDHIAESGMEAPRFVGQRQLVRSGLGGHWTGR